MFRNRQRAVPTYIVPDSTAACEIPPQTRTASPYSLYTVPICTHRGAHIRPTLSHARHNDGTMYPSWPWLQGARFSVSQSRESRRQRTSRPLAYHPLSPERVAAPFEGIAIRPHCGILTPFRSSTQAAAGRAHRGRAHRGRSYRGPRLPLDACKACGTSPRQVRPLLPERSAPASPFTLLSGRPSPSGERATGEQRGRWRSRSRGRPGSCRRRRPS